MLQLTLLQLEDIDDHSALQSKLKAVADQASEQGADLPV